MAENPPLNRIYVLGYSANDRDYPIVSLNADPRVAGYKVPEDLSTCPDKRYPNHVFTGAQPLSGDERVRHVWEILPSPYVPFTRYDDDLGPVQGRRRSVKNDGQVASLAADKKVTYDAREGSAIVYTELEEAWSTATDDDGNSLFPIRDRDFYDASRGPVQERRQLFVPTGEEEGSLENVNGVITQTSYEPYNEFLSVKIVQTYSVDGPALVGKATNNDGQLTTVTTQRKGAKDYVAPSPTATRTVEASREDAESLIERIIDSPNVFDQKQLSVSKPDVIPTQFRASNPPHTSVLTEAGSSATMPTLGEDELESSIARSTEHTVRKSVTSADNQDFPVLSGQEYDASVDVYLPFNEEITESGAKTGSSNTFIDPLSEEFDLVRTIDVDSIKEQLSSILLEFPTRTNLSLPPILKSVNVIWNSVKEDAKFESDFTGFSNGTSYSLSADEDGDSSATITVNPSFRIELEEVYGNNIPTTSYFFFLPYPVTIASILEKVNALQWPVLKPVSNVLSATGESKTVQVRATVNAGVSVSPTNQTSTKKIGTGHSYRASITTETITIPPCLHGYVPITDVGSKTATAKAEVDVGWPSAYNFPVVNVKTTKTIDVAGSTPQGLSQTDPDDIPREGRYLIDSRVEIYQYGYAKVYAEVLDASVFA